MEKLRKERQEGLRDQNKLYLFNSNGSKSHINDQYCIAVALQLCISIYFIACKQLLAYS